MVYAFFHIVLLGIIIKVWKLFFQSKVCHLLGKEFSLCCNSCTYDSKLPPHIKPLDISVKTNKQNHHTPHSSWCFNTKKCESYEVIFYA